MTDPTSPPRLAVLGAGPVGLEVALAAAEARLPFTVYEQGDDVAEHVRRWGHVRLFTPWRDNISSRMLRALGVESRDAFDPDATPTGRELVEEVLEPVAALPGVRENIRTGCSVLGVSKRGFVKSDEIGTGRRGEEPFRILIRARGEEAVETADVVVDCTGTYSNPNALGDGGLPAPGEHGAGDRIVREIPDIATNPAEWAGLRLLLVGSGHSAQTTARDLARICGEGENASVLWAIRSVEPTWGAVEDDPLPEREALTDRARELTGGASPVIEVRTGVVVDSIRRTGSGGVSVRLRPRFGGSAENVEVDRIISLTGSVGDHSLYRQLQYHECYATEGPMKLSAALLASGSADCLDQTSHGADALVNPEPNFFVLGSKSYGRNNTFLMRVGWEQVEEVFGLLLEGC